MVSSLSLFLPLLLCAAAASVPVDISGPVEVLIMERDGQPPQRHYHIFDSSGHRHTLAFEGSSTTVASGSHYRVQGQRTEEDSTIHVSSITPVNTLRTQARSSNKKRWTDANRTIVIVLVQFSDSTYQATPNASSMTEIFWTGSANIGAYFTWVSQGNINFVEDMNKDGKPDIYSVTITDPTICWDIPALAQTAAETSFNVNIMNWEHHVFVLPPDYTNCGVGVANIGCTQGNCNAYCSSTRGDVITHELGHTLGLDHANSLSVQGLSTTPVWTEYMDYSSSMSLSLDKMHRGYNAIDLYNLAVLPASAVSVLSAPVSTTTYSLQDLYASSGTRVIRFTELQIEYHVSYRVGTSGYDTDLSTDLYHPIYTGTWNNEVFIHYPDTVHAPLMSFLSGVEKPGDGAAWTSPGCQWAVEFSSSANGVASVKVGSPSQLGVSCSQGATIPPPVSTTTEELYVYLTSHPEVVVSTIPSATVSPLEISPSVIQETPTPTTAPAPTTKILTAPPATTPRPTTTTTTPRPTTTTPRPATAPPTAPPTTERPTVIAQPTPAPSTARPTPAPTTTPRPTPAPTTTARPTPAPTTTARPTPAPATTPKPTTAKPAITEAKTTPAPVPIAAPLVETTTASATTVPVVQSSSVPVASFGSLFAPAQIAAAFFDKDGFYDTTPQNLGGAYRPTEAVDIQVCPEGGYDVSWMVPGEWMQYTIDVSIAGYYQVAMRTASAEGGAQLFVLMDNFLVASAVSIPQTASATTYTTTMLPDHFYASAGSHVFKVFVYRAGCNLSWFQLKLVATGPALPPPAPLAVSYAQCGNGRCEPGEDCFSCSADCNGYKGAVVSNRFCCSGDVASGYYSTPASTWPNLADAAWQCVPPPSGVLPA